MGGVGSGGAREAGGGGGGARRGVSARYPRTVGGRVVRSAVSSPAPTAPRSSSVRLTSEPAAADPLLEPGRADARVGVLGLTLDERDRLVERRPARTDVRHRFVLV